MSVPVMWYNPFQRTQDTYSPDGKRNRFRAGCGTGGTLFPEELGSWYEKCGSEAEEEAAEAAHREGAFGGWVRSRVGSRERNY